MLRIWPQEIIVCKFGRNRAICRREEAIFVPAQKCPYHVTFDLDLDLESTPWMQAHLETILSKFGRNPAISLREEAICAKRLQTDKRQTPRDCISPWNELTIPMSKIIEKCQICRYRMSSFKL